MQVDYLIVGSGLTGAVIARTLADAGREVLVVDRRSHMGGNVHDHAHSSGIRIHTYGPHYFRTGSQRIWEWATRFGEFYKYEAALLADIGTELVQWPIPASYIRRTFGDAWKGEFLGAASNFEEAALSLMPRAVYETFVRDYTEKQWGVPCTQLDAKLCQRFDIRHDDEPRLKPQARYQGIPAEGYAAWTRRMFDGIPVVLNYDYLQRRDEIKARKYLVFTGPIDELYGFDLGRLQYRGQRRTHEYRPNDDFVQPCGQVNNPLASGGEHIRTLEWKHMMDPVFARRINGTVLTKEVPYSPDNPSDYEYPFPDSANAALYKQYRERAAAEEKLVVAGRLGEYRYFDMDQAIGRAMDIAAKILGYHCGPG